jgi:hypothetical protein
MSQKRGVLKTALSRANTLLHTLSRWYNLNKEEAFINMSFFADKIGCQQSDSQM